MVIAAIIWGLLVLGFAVLAYAVLNWNWGDAVSTMLLTGAVTYILIYGFIGDSLSKVLIELIIPIWSVWLVGVFIGIIIKNRKSLKKLFPPPRSGWRGRSP
jgi:hypothetical protein